MSDGKYKSSHEKRGRVIAKFSSFSGDDVLRVFVKDLISGRMTRLKH